MMSSWGWEETGGNDSKMDDESDRHYMGRTSLPILKPMRKRSSATAGLVDDFVADFERLKLTPQSLERLNVADQHLHHPRFVLILMNSLPEYCLRKLAITCSEWQDLAYKTIRGRRRNNVFSELWLDDKTDRSFIYRNHETATEFTIDFHPAFLHGHYNFTQSNLKTGRSSFRLTPINENCQPPIAHKSSSWLQIPEPKSPTQILAKVGFVLTYGSENMESVVVVSGKSDDITMRSQVCYSTLLALSPSVVVTSPDGKKIIETATMYDRKLLSSVMFPQCSHVVMECFLVPSSETPCFSHVIGTPGSNKKPKVLLLYQYLNLIDCKPGIVEVLQTLQTTHGSPGFPMVTGIYQYVDGYLNTVNPANNSVPIDPVATGLLISGDDFCSTAMMSVNLAGASEYINRELEKIQSFYDANGFSSKIAFLFYHHELTNSGTCFKCFVNSFQSQMPDVGIHGIGSLSGAHAMFVDPNSNDKFNQLNVRMMELTGTVESKTSLAALELILVLLTYQAD